MKKIIACTLAAIMLVLSCVTTVCAESELLIAPLAASEKEQGANDALEGLIKKIKPRLDVPEKYTQFDYDYYAGSYKGEDNWTLEWRDPDNFDAYLTVSCDTDAHITNFRTKSADDQYYWSKVAVPKYLYSELAGTASDFLAKMLPDDFGSFKLDETVKNATVYEASYSYTFYRYINGIKVNGEIAKVSVNYLNGKPFAFSTNMTYGLDYSDAEPKLTADDAKAILCANGGMTLCYGTRYEEDEDGKNHPYAFLYYTPENGYVAVDAQSGEILTGNYEYSTRSAQKNAAAEEFALDVATDEEADAVGGEYTLSEEELSRVTELASLISKEEAIKSITSDSRLYLSPLLSLVDARLAKRVSKTEETDYLWNISFSMDYEKTQDYYSYASAYAEVDAKTGALISFNSTLNGAGYYTKNGIDVPKVNYDENAAKEIFEKFANEKCPEYIANCGECEIGRSNVIEYKENYSDYTYGAYDLNFTRVNEGVTYARNNVYGTVDGITGKISRFGYFWDDDVTFESPKGAMSADEAYAALLSKDGFGLYYEKQHLYIYDDTEPTDDVGRYKAFLRNVFGNMENGGDIDVFVEKYAPDIDREKLDKYVSAFDETMIMLLAADYFGIDKDSAPDFLYDEYQNKYIHEVSTKLVYGLFDIYPTNLSPFTAEQLDYNGKPYRDEKYSYNDIEGHWSERTVRLLADIGIGIDSENFTPDACITDEVFVTLAGSMNLYPTSVTDGKNGVTDDPNKNITRIATLRYLVDCLGYSKIATIDGIFKTDFADGLEVAPGDIGYLAIGKGLGLINGYANMFRSYDFLTFAEAAVMLVNAAGIAD